MLAELPDDVKLIPGHGPVSSKADLRGFSEMLRGCVTRIEAARRAGQSLEQMQEAGVLADYDALGQGFIKTRDFVAQIHAELEAR